MAVDNNELIFCKPLLNPIVTHKESNAMVLPRLSSTRIACSLGESTGPVQHE